jgi:hypothetical protein
MQVTFILHYALYYETDNSVNIFISQYLGGQLELMLSFMDSQQKKYMHVGTV